MTRSYFCHNNNYRDYTDERYSKWKSKWISENSDDVHKILSSCLLYLSAYFRLTFLELISIEKCFSCNRAAMYFLLCWTVKFHHSILLISINMFFVSEENMRIIFRRNLITRLLLERNNVEEAAISF